jgi:formiminotetrahydrofolate cyclodeaminase
MDLRTTTLLDFLDSLGAKTPAPGGGAAASVVGAVGAALGQMVISYSLGKKSLTTHQPELEAARSSLNRARDVLIELAEEDAAGYAALSDLRRLPETDPRRLSEEPTALAASVNAPRAAAAACADLLRLLESMIPISNPSLRSDLAIAALFALAGAESAWWNVTANLRSLPEPERARLEHEGRSLLRDAAARCERIQAACRV